MPARAGGSRPGRGERALVPEPLDFHINITPIAATGQLLPGACRTRSNQRRIGQAQSSPVKPSQTAISTLTMPAAPSIHYSNTPPGRRRGVHGTDGFPIRNRDSSFPSFASVEILFRGVAEIEVFQSVKSVQSVVQFLWLRPCRAHFVPFCGKSAQVPFHEQLTAKIESWRSMVTKFGWI